MLSAIENLRRLGKTILLTTHYLDEAERLADRIAILRAAHRTGRDDAGGRGPSRPGHPHFLHHADGPAPRQIRCRPGST